MATAAAPWGHHCTYTGKSPLPGQRLGLPGKPLPGWLGFAASCKDAHGAGLIHLGLMATLSSPNRKMAFILAKA